MLAAGGRQFEDWSAAYRLFEKERFDRKALFAPATEAVLGHLQADEPMVVMIDDTLIRKRGRKIHGTAWKRDPLGPHFSTNFVWGQRFLQLSAALPDTTEEGRARSIPIDFIHAPSAAKPKKKAPPEVWQAYRKEQEQMKVSAVASRRLHELRGQVEDKRIICAVDGGFTNSTVFRNLPENTVMIGRIRKDAKLFEVPEESEGGRRGRKKFYGKPLPTPEEIRLDSSRPWQQVEAYAAGTRHLFELKTLSAVRWRGSGERTARLVVVRPLAYRPRKGAKLLYRNPAYLLCTDPSLPLERLLQSYLWRWEIEVGFRDEKTVMGVGEAQVRTPSAAQNVPSLIVAAYAYLLLAGTAVGAKEPGFTRPKWYLAKHAQRSTTQEMLALFRTQLWGIAIEGNLRHFDNSPSATRTPFYSSFAVANAVVHARK